MALGSDTPTTHRNRGICLALAGRPGEAVGEYGRAIKLEDDTVTRISRASAL